MLKYGDQAPDFQLKGVDGRIYKLSGYKNKRAVSVIFSCNHCPYVKAYEDRMISLAKEYEPKGVQFLVINSNDPQKYPEDSFDHMIQRAKERGYPFPYLHDETQQVAKAYGAQRTPEIFLFDSSLRLRYHGAIDDNYEDPTKVKKHYLKEALDAVLAGREPDLKETQPVGCTVKWK